ATSATASTVTKRSRRHKGERPSEFLTSGVVILVSYLRAALLVALAAIRFRAEPAKIRPTDFFSPADDTLKCGVNVINFPFKPLPNDVELSFARRADLAAKKKGAMWESRLC